MKLWVEGVMARDNVCCRWPFTTLKGKKCFTYSIFLPCRNSLQFCSIPGVKRSNHLANSYETTVNSPGFLVCHCVRMVNALVLGWNEAGCPEDEDWETFLPPVTSLVFLCFLMYLFALNANKIYMFSYLLCCV